MFVTRARVILLAATIGAPSLAAQTRVGFFGGMSLTTFAGADAGNPDARKGMQAGGFVIFPATPNLAFRTGLTYVQKGAEDTITGVARVRFALTYVELPLLARVSFLNAQKISAYALGGVAIGFKTGCNFEIEDASGKQSIACDNTALQAFPVKSRDFNVSADGGVLFAPEDKISLVIDVLHQWGMGTIDASAQPPSIKNKGWQIGMGIAFNLAR